MSISWWAIVGKNGGFALDVYPDEEQKTRAAIRRNRERVAGTFSTVDEAHACVMKTLQADRRRGRGRRGM